MVNLSVQMISLVICIKSLLHLTDLVFDFADFLKNIAPVSIHTVQFVQGYSEASVESSVVLC